MRILSFTRYLLARFFKNQGMPNAASLTFTTLLSLVPLMTVSMAVISLLSISDQISDQIQHFVFENFVPASGAVLQGHLAQFSEKASRLTGPGFLFLLVVALMMMASIDRVFNHIWQVRRKRSPLSLFLVYWATLSLGPLLMGLSIAVSTYLISMPLFKEIAEELAFTSHLLSLAPVLASMVAFSMLYLLVPNRRVPLKYAVMGGLLAAILFELAKRGFALYITQFPTYEAIYGALAIVPIFLIWIYLSWVITLLGAEFTYCIEHYEYGGELEQYSRRDRFSLLYRMLKQLWLNQQSGNTVSLQRLGAQMKDVPEIYLEEGLELLGEARLVVCSESREWVLSQSLSQYSVYQLLHLAGGGMADPKVLLSAEENSAHELGLLLGKAKGEIESTLAVPLDQFLSVLAE